MITIQPQARFVAVRATGVKSKITVNHNATVVRATGVKSKITVNHNATVVRASQSK